MWTDTDFVAEAAVDVAALTAKNAADLRCSCFALIRDCPGFQSVVVGSSGVEFGFVRAPMLDAVAMPMARFPIGVCGARDSS